MASQEGPQTQAFVTLATNDTYALGALVLGHSLRDVGTTRRLAVMITQGVTQGIRQQLSEVFDHVTVVDVLDSGDAANLGLLARPDLGITFTKLHCWRLTQFTKCVFMDADTLVLQNIDELFEREELSAAPDAGWPDCFNSGVFVFRPSEETYQALLQFAIQHGSFDGGDQGLLNLYFSDWATKDINKHLSFVYNVVSQAFYSYLPAFKQFQGNVKVVHFIGAAKPWHQKFNTATGQVEHTGGVEHNTQFLQRWWNLFMAKVQTHLDSSVVRMLRMVFQPPPEASTKSAYGGSSHAYPTFEPCPTSMQTPFIPPEVNVFYNAPAVANVPSETIDPPDRPYTFYESFYSEPPMTTKEEYVSPQEIYDAKTFTQVWTDHNQTMTTEDSSNDVVTAAQDEQTGHNEDMAVEDNSNDVGTGPSEHADSSQRRDEEAAGTADGHEEVRSGGASEQGTGGAHLEKTGCGSSGGTEECGHMSTTEVGVVDSMASVTLDPAAASGVTTADHERQYQWEKGQIDYLGEDSFANIQAQLDSVINAKPPGK